MFLSKVEIAKFEWVVISCIYNCIYVNEITYDGPYVLQRILLIFLTAEINESADMEDLVDDFVTFYAAG